MHTAMLVLAGDERFFSLAYAAFKLHYSLTLARGPRCGQLHSPVQVGSQSGWWRPRGSLPIEASQPKRKTLQGTGSGARKGRMFGRVAGWGEESRDRRRRSKGREEGKWVVGGEGGSVHEDTASTA